VNPLTGAHYIAGFNLTMAPFDNKLLRQALSFAVDKRRFVETILGGVGAPESLPWLPVSPAYSQLNDLLLDQVFVLPISIAPPLLLARSNVRGIQWTTHESPWYGDHVAQLEVRPTSRFLAQDAVGRTSVTDLLLGRRPKTSRRTLSVSAAFLEAGVDAAWVKRVAERIRQIVEPQ
jgi:extracellular solute-binding protein (family 5)